MKSIDFEKTGGLVPAIIQDSNTRAVLMLGYMDAEALEATKSSGKVTFYSRSKKRLWTKGESSGNFLEFVDVRVDCDGDALLIRARPTGPVCHTGSDTCWDEANPGDEDFLPELEAIIASRKEQADTPGGEANSYVAGLLRRGTAKVAQKVGEEAVETVIEAMGSDDNRFLNESADLLFHWLILLQAKGFRMADIERLLAERHRQRR
ncbi:bifunctional phosphoribosyl-AMP cyclohydrolase/phosphoribosyl-ATP diphosphatase HisIE [Robiginitalea biformata]|uniref:Histidine biosynthesis bifunctional protein HisIE n=1 Tax=Robiginitalea biformata (strain ATCC BAA-864 / DSM 15991 / KCTC 12146 / HTCC2501) TaxID=313596 RepID=A4CLC1_ROBBH|nr:bifunctional phosphoribosyl-AMP cyclohydrolase/phosphoribosyl-ATP diphosphatase HisIE [Robiginitalea biformata]EAR15670.1 phosphoribosyl-AMP cyclohydrolase/phosphoribosyl-ATP pyrophosphohydrolase [Robiginitalea biformata HTCC2501]